MRPQRKYLRGAALLLLLAGVLAGCEGRNPDEAQKPALLVYSARQEQLLKPLLKLYEEQQGIPVRFVSAAEGALLTRLQAEGARSPADLLITTDAGNLWHAAQSGLALEVDSQTLRDNIPAHLRDPGKRWFGLSKRVRAIVYHPQRVQPSALSSYAALADPQWKGRLCLRTSKKVYNQSLVAALISTYGEQAVEKIVRGWVANLAIPPLASDTKALEAVLAGVCDLSIVNSYYLGRMKSKRPLLPLAIFWPDQEGAGAHANVSGAMVLQHGSQHPAAIAFLEWLSQPQAQRLFADLNHEFPVHPAVTPSALVASWGSFREDHSAVHQAGPLQTKAIRLMDRAGYR